jgi:hypothetical protein
MCETNNAENSKSCIICQTKKEDAKKYYENLNETVELRKRVKSSLDTEKSLNKASDDIETTPIRDKKDWIDSMKHELKREEKMRIISTCGTIEGIAIALLIVSAFLSIILMRGNLRSLIFTLIVSIYITVRGVTVINAKKWVRFIIKLMIWIGICAIFGLIAIIVW